MYTSGAGKFGKLKHWPNLSYLCDGFAGRQNMTNLDQAPLLYQKRAENQSPLIKAMFYALWEYQTKFAKLEEEIWQIKALA